MMEAHSVPPNRGCAGCLSGRVDKLTGLADRWSWEEQAPQLLYDSQVRGEYAALLLIDLDRFKTINDKWGHLAGDAVLAGVADVLRRFVPPGGLAGRYGGCGGDEYLILLPRMNADRATEIAELIRLGIQSLTISAPATTGSQVVMSGITASAGLSVRPPDDNSDLEALILAADAGLQQAKRGGRNQLRVARSSIVDNPSSQGERPAAAFIDKSEDRNARSASLQDLLNFSHMMSGQWNPDILLALSAGPLRYTDLLTNIRDSTAVDGWSGRNRQIQTSILNRTLRRLERDGLVHRTEESGVWPRSVHYALSNAAHDLLNAVMPGVLWSQQHQEMISQAQRRAVCRAG